MPPSLGEPVSASGVRWRDSASRAGVGCSRARRDCVRRMDAQPGVPVAGQHHEGNALGFDVPTHSGIDSCQARGFQAAWPQNPRPPCPTRPISRTHGRSHSAPHQKDLPERSPPLRARLYALPAAWSPRANSIYTLQPFVELPEAWSSVTPR